MAEAIKVEGVAEVTRAFRQIDGKLARDFGNDLKKSAEPVVDASRSKVTRFAGASVGTIRAKRSGARVFVEQSARKVTGNKGDYGATQMRTVLIPALDENQEAVFQAVSDTLDRYADSAGF